ncbi:hypothetical protein SESBI_24472 [Sesbania bispinosa]|nr:hypothetical protein SESBI_24472 [Sesbania bispinosa]
MVRHPFHKKSKIYSSTTLLHNNMTRRWQGGACNTMARKSREQQQGRRTMVMCVRRCWNESEGNRVCTSDRGTTTQ